jgi:hypothetical protein
MEDASVDHQARQFPIAQKRHCGPVEQKKNKRKRFDLSVAFHQKLRTASSATVAMTHALAGILPGCCRVPTPGSKVGSARRIEAQNEAHTRTCAGT